MDDRERMFNQYGYVAKEVAMYFTRRWGRAFHETLDHAEFALALLVCGGAGEYDPERGPIEAWLRFKMIKHLMSIYHRGYHPHCGRWIREPHKRGRLRANTQELEHWDEVEALTPSSGPKPDTSWINRFLREASEEAGALIQILCDAPADLLKEICPKIGRPRHRKQAKLAQYLMDVLDWSEQKVQRAFAEVEACLNP